MTLRIGSTFSGYGGLDLATMSVFGGLVAWHCENDPAASAVLAHYWPGVPNLGDITAVDWSTVEPVDILTGGFPCQDISSAGRRAGIEGTRSGLWRYLADAVRVLRPRVVVLENVSAVLVRGLDRVLADLAGVGYDVRWTCLRASDVGAPHRRNRWFAIAFPDTDSTTGGQRRVSASGQAESWRTRADVGGRGGTPSTDAESDGWPDGWPEGRPEPARIQRGPDAAVIPAATRSGGGTTAYADGSAHGTEPHREPQQCEADNDQRRLDPAGRVLEWGRYEPAIRRWEAIIGYPAPEPTVVGQRGGRQLNPAFVEWMMGVPGHITSVPGLSRNDMLKLAGNGVVPQQGVAALHRLLSLSTLDERTSLSGQEISYNKKGA